MAKIPIVPASSTFQLSVSELVNTITIQICELQNLLFNFSKLIKSKFEINKLKKKLQSWHKLEFSEFLAELKKSKIKLSLSEEAEWMEYFNEQKAKALELKAEIDKTDKEIDQMVYELYGLTDEEIKIVEERI